jgi:hypothetical protein
MGTACFQGNILRRFELDVNVKNKLLQWCDPRRDTSSQVFACNTLHTWKSTNHRDIFMGVLSAEVFVGKVALSYVP